MSIQAAAVIPDNETRFKRLLCGLVGLPLPGHDSLTALMGR